MTDRPKVWKAGERSPGATAQTSGMQREEFFAGQGVWVGLVRTAPGMASDWHHHGEHDTYLYIASGRARLEFGPGGAETAEVVAGDVAHVPQHLVHRESNPGDQESQIFVVRVGSGPPVINVDSPPA